MYIRYTKPQRISTARLPSGQLGDVEARGAARDARLVVRAVGGDALLGPRLHVEVSFPIVTSQCSSATLYQVSCHIQYLFF
jgi:hypothetical protein